VDSARTKSVPEERCDASGRAGSGVTSAWEACSGAPAALGDEGTTHASARRQAVGAEAWDHSVFALLESLPPPFVADDALKDVGKELDKRNRSRGEFSYKSA